MVRRLTVADFGEVLEQHDRFWDGRDLRSLHHPMFVHEFGETALAVGDDEVLAYLLGFCAPTRVGYIHLVATREDARGRGLARALYDGFTDRMRATGATGLKAITTAQNTGSIAFHHRLGFTDELVTNYSGPGADRVVLSKPL